MADRIKMEIEYFQVPNGIFDLDINIAVEERKKVKGNKKVTTITRPLKTYEKLIYIYLCRCGNQGNQAFPSYNTIAKNCGIGRKTAIEAVANLIKNGLLEKRTREKEGASENNSNIYFVLKPQKELSGSVHSAPPSALSTPPLVRQAHHPSVPGAPKKELLKKNNIKKEQIKYTQSFLEWYELYPNPWNKEQSFKNFKKLLREGEVFGNVMIATKNYIAYLKHRGTTDKQYIVRSTNFIGNKKDYLGYLNMDVELEIKNNTDWRI